MWRHSVLRPLVAVAALSMLWHPVSADMLRQDCRPLIVPNCKGKKELSATMHKQDRVFVGDRWTTTLLECLSKSATADQASTAAAMLQLGPAPDGSGVLAPGPLPVDHSCSPDAATEPLQVPLPRSSETKTPLPRSPAKMPAQTPAHDKAAAVPKEISLDGGENMVVVSGRTKLPNAGLHKCTKLLPPTAIATLPWRGIGCCCVGAQSHF